MRAVADTNVVVSGLLWHGASRQVLGHARAGQVELFTSPMLLVELEDVLLREKFARRLAAAGVNPRDLLLGYASLATVITPPPIEQAVVADPDDDAVLACALAARAEVVVSGDRHLLTLKVFQGIPIHTPARLLSELPR
jgi:putative PIN family toxin of toxin-antitoxin system